MSATTHTLPGAPGPHRDDWIDFLHWMVDERGYSGHDAVDVIEKPAKYAEEYTGYLAEGGAGR